MTSRALEWSLDALEELELPALSWGITDASLDQNEASGAIAAALEQAGDYQTPPQSLLAELEKRCLIVPIQEGGYRTRIGEAVRLLSTLRQLFPDHLANETWPSAPRLVTDFRFLRRSRRFPIRSIPAEDAIQGIQERRLLSETQVLALRALVNGVGQPLARFQVDAARRILQCIGGATPSATVVAAGTGSGKTLAFYVPALIDIVGQLSAAPFTKVIAVYPRTELLKDQLTEVMRQTRVLDKPLRDAGLRPISVGALFGSTPHDRRSAETQGWRDVGGGDLVCPFMACPNCGGDLVWPKTGADIIWATLRCRGCGKTVGTDHAVITRKALAASPPDILFTTTEMLNQRLSTTPLRRVFGVGALSAPRLLLLDEVHLYEGTTGGQTAFTLRRWQHLVGAPVHVVGLSATLEQPEDFVASLTGVPAANVACVQPAESELTDRGAEYLVALRGNPMSKSALLSTTIQTLMLARRILDREADKPSGGFFGSRVFAFADNLDVVNRLHEFLCDAEGRDPENRPTGAESLAKLRDPSAHAGSDLWQRRRDGQVWDLPKLIDDTFGRSRSIELVTSQSAGVPSSAEIVAATASLEVGFNDPLVGAVLQHKASRSASAFLQRKGRAGRTAQIRPLTLLVLSDYGRDRLAFQGYEHLFDPVLRPTPLPTGNRHLQKVQAAAALLDYLATQLDAQGIEAELWSDLAGPPAQPTAQWGQKTLDVQRAVAEVLEMLLDDPLATADLRSYLQDALKLDGPAVDAVLWSPPRALLVTGVPTLLRRLTTGWSAPARPSGREEQHRSPMPEHLTSTLFAALALPEVEIEPRLRTGNPLPRATLPISQALQEIAPGRVTKRFAPRTAARHWVEVRSGSPAVDVSTFLDDYESIGPFSLPDGQTIRCLRPVTAHLTEAPAHVSTSQNARLSWQTELVTRAHGRDLHLPRSTNWGSLIAGIRIHTHRERTEVEVRRFADSVRADDPSRNGRSLQLSFTCSDQGEAQPVALGFTYTADAIRIRLRTPEHWPVDDALDRALRSAAFRDDTEHSPLLPESANSFARGWLATLYLAAVTGIATREQCSGTDARKKLEQHGIGVVLRQVMTIVFDSADGHSGSPGTARIDELLADSAMTQALHNLGERLTTPATQIEPELLLPLFATTVGAAMREGCQRMCPSLDMDDLIPDITPGCNEPAPPGYLDVWLTEEEVGGVGIVEEIARQAGEDPRRLLALAEGALGPTDHERIDATLSNLAVAATADQETAGLIADARTASSPAERRDRLMRILQHLTRFGEAGGHAVATAIATRVMRSGATPQIDSIVASIVGEWAALEQRLGFEAEPRALAFALRDAYSGKLESAVGNPRSDAGSTWRFSQIYSLLWPSGRDARTAGLGAYSPYCDLPQPERLLVRALLDMDSPTVDASTPDWRASVEAVLREQGEVRLTGFGEALAHLRSAILDLACTPIDTGLLLAYPRITGTRSDRDRTVVKLELIEVM